MFTEHSYKYDARGSKTMNNSGKKPKSIIAIKEQRAAYIFLIPALLGLSFITYLPLVAAFGVGLTDLKVGHFITGGTEFIGLFNYIDIFKNPVGSND